MKDLSDIINTLQQINDKVIEKDNVINWCTDLINLFSQLIVDPSLKQSEIYLDLRMKYISKIEEKLQKINSANLVIEPETIIKHVNQSTSDNQSEIAQPKNKKKIPTITSDKIIAPLKTDIFMAPGNRYKIGKKKVDKSTGESNQPETEYIQFNHNHKEYFIETTPNDEKAEIPTYDIVDINYGIMGKLEGHQIILLNGSDLTKSETIDLKIIADASKLLKDNKLFGNYYNNE